VAHRLQQAALLIEPNWRDALGDARETAWLSGDQPGCRAGAAVRGSNLSPMPPGVCGTTIAAAV
jgi:hypothetical protein